MLIKKKIKLGNSLVRHSLQPHRASNQMTNDKWTLTGGQRAKDSNIYTNDIHTYAASSMRHVVCANLAI